ncbi:MAG TPA: LamG domain-containing protein [Verrucomicrobiota bacterium]|nr:LamG domain-containing protein [Verrucomicrobiota bacterium]
MADPYFDHVSLLLPLEGVNNQRAIVDYAPTPNIITVADNTKISTAQSKWGQGSGLFDGNGDYLTLSHTSEFEFGTDNFTVEAWIRLTGYTIVQSGLYRGEILGKPSSFEFRLQGTASSWDSLRVNIVGSTTVTPEANFSFSLNTWYHIAFVRASGTVAIYVNGTALTTANASANVANAVNANNIYIGGLSTVNYGYFFPGYLQDLRVTKGVARYTAHFTPPSRLLIQHCLPVSGQVTTIAGNCIVSGNGGAQQVVIRDASTRILVALATPNATTGDWSTSVPPGDYDISYFAPGCQPICHGPYTVAPP